MTNFSLEKEKIKYLAKQTAVKYGLNEDLFLKQIQQESGFNPNAKSHAGAIGLGQIMPATAKGMGIKPESLRDPAINLDTAAKIMQKNLKTYNNDYILALAAYNGGGGAVDFVQKQVGRPITGQEWIQFNSERQQKKGKNPNAWHTQTLDYVNKITGQSQPMQLAQATPTQQPYSQHQENGQIPQQEQPQSSGQTQLTPEMMQSFMSYFNQQQPQQTAPQLEELKLALQQRDIQTREMEMQALQHQQMLNEQIQQQKTKDQVTSASQALMSMGNLAPQRPQMNMAYNPIETYTPQLDMSQENPWRGFGSSRSYN